GRRVHGDRLDSELVQRTDHADGDLAAVRHQHALEHQSPGGRPLTGSSSNRSCPYSTGCAFSARIRWTIPSWSALTSFISFIASSMQSVWPIPTVSPSWTNGSAPGEGAR